MNHTGIIQGNTSLLLRKTFIEVGTEKGVRMDACNVTVSDAIVYVEGSALNTFITFTSTEGN